MKNKKNRKTLVLDTSVLVYNATAFKSFHSCDIIIPIIVLEELDKVKKNTNEGGKNARVAIRFLDEISERGPIHMGVEIDNDCVIKIETFEPQAIGSDPAYGDNKILACVEHIRVANEDVILLTRDINLRIRARARGITSEDYNHDRAPDLDLYAGVQRIQNEDMGANLLMNGELTAEEYPFIASLYPNECIIITADDGRVIALGRKTKAFVKIIRERDPWGLQARSPEQQLAMDMIMDPKIPLVSIVGPAGGGKSLVSLACGLELVLNQKKYATFSIYRPIQSMGADIGYLPGPQPLDAKILTPNGWTTMGNITVGSKIISRDGKETNVVGVYPKGKKTVYKITTTDGASTECCEDHLWFTQTSENKKRNKPGSVKTTKEIYNTLINKFGKLNHFLPRNEAIHYKGVSLPLSPYSMGVFLGDGCSTDSTTIHNTDKNILHKYGLRNKKAWEKFIPDDYKYSNIEDRIELLRGLMDTDGAIKKNGEASYCTTSIKLAEDVVELVRSLGGRAIICERDRINHKRGSINGREIQSKRISYEFTVSLPKHINPFYISRKAKHHKCSYVHYPKIESIEYIGVKEVQCIRVDNPEHLYITDDFIVTHNTTEEKLSPHYASIDDGFQFLFQDVGIGKKKTSWREQLHQYIDNGTITKEALSYIRGRSISNSFILIDETQNLSKEEVKTIVTRVGQGSKIILTGDPSQIDNHHLDATSNGLSYLIDKFQKSHLSGHITLSKGERSLLATEAAELL